jgi:hypothetical protein
MIDHALRDNSIPFDVHAAREGYPVQYWRDSISRWIDVFYIGQSMDGLVTFSHLDEANSRLTHVAAPLMFRMAPGGHRNLSARLHVERDSKTGAIIERQQRVVIESPFVGKDTDYEGQFDLNVTYARRALLDCLERGEAPFASHLLYTQVGTPNDGDPSERERGIRAGLTWASNSDLTVFYVDYGMSAGMRSALRLCDNEGREWIKRVIGKNP